MKAILVFIDGTICDRRARHPLLGAPGFYQPELILKDSPVPGSADCLQELAKSYAIVYLVARPEATRAATLAWLRLNGYPAGPLYLAETQPERLAIVCQLREQHDFIAGIGDRWDDNQLHLELGCLSVILKEFEGDWGPVADRIVSHHRNQKIKQNELHLQGKIEGLDR